MNIRRQRVPVVVVLAMVITVAWQWATVSANYGGNWTALYCTGALMPHPPLVASERIYIFPNSTGYDGQLYHYVAHDPLMRSKLRSFVDDPRFRYRRILVPALAYLLALGHSDWIDPAYEIVLLLMVGLGAYWASRIAQTNGLSPFWGLLLLLIPAVPVTMDRLVVDGALAILTVGFVYSSKGPIWKLFLILACTALTRETGFFLIAAACLSCLVQRNYRRMVLLAASAVPAFAWYAYLQSRTSPSPYAFSHIPFSAIVHVLATPWHYPVGTQFPGLLLVADYVSLIGVLLALALAFYLVVRKPTGAVTIAAGLFATLAVVVQRADHWQNVYDFGRLQSPLIVCVVATAACERKLWMLLPLAMILPRLSIQFAPQLLGVIHWL